MSFEKTVQDLDVVRRLPPGQMNANAVLSVMMDLLVDLVAATGKELAQLPIDEESVAAWLAVGRAMTTVPVAESAASLSARRRQRLDQLKQDLEQVVSSIAKSEAELNNVSTYIAALKEKEAQLHAAMAQQQQADADRQQFENEIRTLQQQLAASPEIDTQTLAQQKNLLKQQLGRNQAAADDLRQLQADVRQAEQAHQELERKLATQTSQQVQLHGENDRLSDAYQAAKEQCDVLQHQIAATQQKIASLNQTLKEGIPEALVQQQQQLQQKLKQIYAERTTLAEQIQQLQGQITALEQENDAQTQTAQQLQATRKQLDQQLTDARQAVADQQMQVASRSKQLEEQSQILADQNCTIEGLQRQIAETVQKVQAQEEQLAQIHQAIQDKHNALEALKEKCDGENTKIQEANAACRQYQLELANLEAEVHAITTRRTELQDQLERMQKERAVKKIETDDLKDDIQKIGEDIILLDKTAETQRKQIDSKQLEYQAVKEQMAQNEVRLQQLATEVQQASEAQQEQQDSIHAHETKKKETQMTTEALLKEQANKKLELQMLTEKLERVTADTEQVRQQLEQLEQRYSKALAEKKSRTNQTAELEETLEQIQADSDEAEKQIRKLSRDIAESKEAFATYQKFFDSEDCRKKKSQIANYQVILDLYRDGIQQLFGTNPPVENLEALVYDYEKKKNELSGQLQTVQGILRNLSANYIDIITQIEKKVNLS